MQEGEVLRCINQGSIIEVHNNKENDLRVLLRSKNRRGAYTCVVVSLATDSIITVYENDGDDDHPTLNIRAYKWNVNLVEAINHMKAIKKVKTMGYTIEEKLLTKNEYTRPGTKLKAIKGVIIHWTANMAKGAGADSHYRYFQNNRERYASAHYFVDDSKILRIVPDNELCYHVGAKKYLTTYFGSYPNNSTIGVEMCVNPDGDFAETYRKSVWLCAHLLYKYQLDPATDLARHNDITGKDCPRMFVDNEYSKKFLNMTAASAWATFRADVKKAYNEMKNPTPVKPAPAKPAPTPEKVAELMSKYFKDVAANRWSADEIDKAKELGLMTGKTDTTFEPTGAVTREELAAVAVRIYEKLK